MALATSQRARFARPPLLVLYSRPPGDFALQDARTARLRRELGVPVETCSPADVARRCRTWVSTTQPTLVILREDQILAMAVGSLPLRELEQLLMQSH